jgi:ankyrin repeat protein
MNDWYENEQLHFAVQDGNAGKVKSLISDGYDVNLFDEVGYTPLHYAIKNENIEIAQILIESGADVNAHDIDNAGNTPLAEVAQSCSIKVAKFLIRKGADPTIQGWMKLSALDRARKRKKPEGVEVYELLLDWTNDPKK